MTLNRRDFTLTSLSALGALAMNPTLAAEPPVNRRIVLASRPRGKPTLDNFRLEKTAVPKYKKYKWGIGKKSTRAPQIFDPKMTLNHP